ncbi:MAG: hypothetical protein RSC89_06935 [Oscillospiraceae bacterium]
MNRIEQVPRDAAGCRVHTAGRVTRKFAGNTTAEELVHRLIAAHS